MKTPTQLHFDFGPHFTGPEAQAANEARIEISSYKAREQDRFYRSKAWRRMRLDVLNKYGARCQTCGCTKRDARIDVDHILPRSRAPQLALFIENLQVLCEACHEAKTYRDGLRQTPSTVTTPPKSHAAEGGSSPG